jgi:hypothetical protein
MISRLHLFIIVTISLLLTSVILIMYTQQREQDFMQHRLEIQKAMVEGTASEISYRIENQIRMVQLFNDEYRLLLSHLAQFPQDENTREIIDTRLTQRFSGKETFTITDSQGNPILDDFEGRVGDICKRDISSFSTEVKHFKHSKPVSNAIFIHPQTGHYHYDVMAAVKDGSMARSIFFVSFSPEPIQNILKSRELPGHELMLTRLHDNTLIEISSAGTRDIMARDGRLKKKEFQTVNISRPIPHTDWVLIDLKDPVYEQDYIRRLWKESSGIILIVAITNLIIFFIFSARISYTEIRENKRENKAYRWVKRKP